MGTAVARKSTGPGIPEASFTANWLFPERAPPNISTTFKPSPWLLGGEPCPPAKASLRPIFEVAGVVEQDKGCPPGFQVQKRQRGGGRAKMPPPLGTQPQQVAEEPSQ